MANQIKSTNGGSCRYSNNPVDTNTAVQNVATDNGHYGSLKLYIHVLALLDGGF